MGYGISTEFIGKPHESSPRRLYSQTGADWQYRVDFDRTIPCTRRSTSCGPETRRQT